MKTLSKYIGEDLILGQPSFWKREYELRSSNELLAKMYFPKFFSLTAVVDGFDKKYEIFRPSIWKNNVAIRKYAFDMSFASLTTTFLKQRDQSIYKMGKN